MWYRLQHVLEERKDAPPNWIVIIGGMLRLESDFNLILEGSNDLGCGATPAELVKNIQKLHSVCELVCVGHAGRVLSLFIVPMTLCCSVGSKLSLERSHSTARYTVSHLCATFLGCSLC